MINYLSSMFLGKNLETGNKLITNSGYFFPQEYTTYLVLYFCIISSQNQRRGLKNSENLELN